MPWVGPESNLGAPLTGGVSPGSNPCRRALFWLAVWPGRLGTRVCSQHSARALLSRLPVIVVILIAVNCLTNGS